MKKIIAASLCVLASMSTQASEDKATETKWVFGTGYSVFSEDSDGMEISLGALFGSIGYQFKLSENVFFLPELRYGVGISDDTVSMDGINVDVELDNYVALSAKGLWHATDQVYVYAMPSFAKVEMSATATYMGYTASESDTSDWEFGLGLGIGYLLSPTTGLEMSLEQFDGTNVFSLGAKFAF